MESLLQGISHVSIYLDDILVTGISEAEHLAILDKVLSPLEETGLRLKRNKCDFILPSVEYLGTRYLLKDSSHLGRRSEQSEKPLLPVMYHNYDHF